MTQAGGGGHVFLIVWRGMDRFKEVEHNLFFLQGGRKSMDPERWKRTFPRCRNMSGGKIAVTFEPMM